MFQQSMGITVLQINQISLLSGVSPITRLTFLCDFNLHLDTGFDTMHGVFHGPAKTTMEAMVAPLGQINATLSSEQRQVTVGGILGEEEKDRINSVLRGFEKTPEMKAERFPSNIGKVHDFKANISKNPLFSDTHN